MFSFFALSLMTTELSWREVLVISLGNLRGKKQQATLTLDKFGKEAAELIWRNFCFRI